MQNPIISIEVPDEDGPFGPPDRHYVKDGNVFVVNAPDGTLLVTVYKRKPCPDFSTQPDQRLLTEALRQLVQDDLVDSSLGTAVIPDTVIVGRELSFLLREMVDIVPPRGDLGRYPTKDRGPRRNREDGDYG